MSLFADSGASASRLSWPGLSRPSTSSSVRRPKTCHARDKRGHDGRLRLDSGSDRARSQSYAQGGIVARLAVKSESLIQPSGLPSSFTSTLDHSPDCASTLTFAFFGTRLSNLQPPALLSWTTGVALIAK